jgi:HSP20 family protein
MRKENTANAKSMVPAAAGSLWPSWNRLPRLFDSDDFFAPFKMSEFGSMEFAPKVNWIERKKKLILEAELPGMKKEDVQIELDDDVLILRGERRDENEVEEDDFVRRESRYGSFYRAIPLGFHVEFDQVHANFKNGMLHIEMPKPKDLERKRRQVAIS